MIGISKVSLLEDRIGLLLIKLSCPAMLGMIIYSFLSLIDIFFIARLGPSSMAALTLCLPIYLAVISLASGTGVGLTSVIARTLGEGDIRNADNLAWHGLFISIIYGAVFMWLGLKNIDYLLILFGCTPDIFALSKGYLTINILACMFTFPPMIIASIIQGEGNTIIPMITSLVGIAINVVLDPIFIFGIGPIKPMGLNGAALASVFAQIVLAVIFILIIIKRKDKLPWLIHNFKPGLKALGGIYKVGIPTTIMEIISIIVMVFINRILAGYGYTSLAALGIFLRIRSLFYMPVHGLVQGTLPIAGFAYGARNYDRIKETIIKSCVIAFLIMGSGWVIIQSYPTWIMNFFSTDPALTAMGIRCLKFATMALPVMGPIIIFYTVLQAMGKGTTAMWLSLIRQVGLFLPLLVILPHFLGLDGVWLSFSISEFLSALLATYFLINIWRKLQTRRKQALIMFFKPGFLTSRILAWLKW